MKTGAELNEQQKQVQKFAEELVRTMQLKKWAIDQAVKVASSNPVVGFKDIKELTGFFYDFVVKDQPPVPLESPGKTGKI